MVLQIDETGVLEAGQYGLRCGFLGGSIVVEEGRKVNELGRRMSVMIPPWYEPRNIPE